MRRYSGLDTKGLVGTGRWRDEQSASRYQRIVVSEESARAELLPIPKAKTGNPNPCKLGAIRRTLAVSY